VAEGPTFGIPPELLSGSSGYFGVEIRDGARLELKNKGPAVSLFMSHLSPIRIVGIERSPSVE